MSSRRFWIGAIITDPNSSLVHPLRILQTVSMERAGLIPPNRRDDGDRVYIGRFIGDFHMDEDVIQDILARLTRDETLNAYPARLRAKDGSTKYVMINSNVYHEKGGEFGHTRCFTTEIGEAAWKALKSNK